MNRQISYGSDFEFSPELNGGMFHEGIFGESENGLSGCPSFVAVPIENPGGGRVKDKKAPKPEDVVNVARAFSGKVPLHRLTAAALNALQCAASADGLKAPLLRPTSGFRDPQVQAGLWATALKRYGSPEEARKWVAPPGTSAHQSGRAIDFYLGGPNGSGNVANLRRLRAYHWLVANASRFGFYPYEREPWHWEYNPPASAQQGTPPASAQQGTFGVGETQSKTGKRCKKDRCDPEYMRWVQQSLNKVLGLRLSEDGQPGQKTRSAIRSFQQKQSLKPDASMGERTEQALIAAGASQPPALKDLPCGGTPTAQLVGLLNKYRGDIPLHFLLGWIKVESGGRIDSITNLCERGFFQIHPEESQDRGWKHEPISYDPDYSIERGVRLVREMVGRTEKLATKYGISKQSDAFWGLVKLHHWIPSAPAKILEHMSKHGVKPSTWDAIRDYIVKDQARIPALGHWNPVDGVRNATETLRQANAAQTQEFEYEEELVGFGKAGQQSSSGAPALIKEESDPPGKTIYVKIPLGDERPARPMTGIFCPSHFQPRPQVDLIIYLHGIKPRSDLSVDRYWNKKYYPHFALREDLNKSSKNAILVWPTLGPRSQSQTGWLTNTGGLDRFIDQVLAALVAYGPYQKAGQPPQVGNIILACHSGGGLPMRKLALGKNRYASQIKECWGFDCLYFGGDETLWPQWAKARPDAKLFIYFQGTTRMRSEKLSKQRIPNISVSRSSAKGHNWVPIHHLRERLDAAPLQSRPSNGTGPGVNQEWGWRSIMDWFKPSGPASTQPSTSPARPSGTTGTSPLALAVRTNALALANQEWNRWNQGKTKEGDATMRPVLEDYWLSGAGSKRHETNWWSAVPWSAAFISWVMRKAGAGKDFKYSAGHSVYTAAAKENAIKNNNNLFKAYPISKVAPRLGDIVCKSRSGSGATYESITPGMNTHCDIVTDVQPNRISVIGGNVSQSVSKKQVTTNPNGLINARDYFAVIRVGA